MSPQRLCVAPLADGTICPEIATHVRVIADLDESGMPTGEKTICPLCAEHAAEIDRETDSN